MTMAYVYFPSDGALEMAHKRSGDSSFATFLKESESPKKGKVSTSCGPTDNFQSSVVQLKVSSVTNNLKLRVVHLAVGSVGTRYSSCAPLLVVDFVDTNGVCVRGYTFTKSLVRSVPQVLHLDDIVFVQGGLVEVSDTDYTWVQSSVAIKFVSNTEFVVDKPDDSFARVRWNLKSVGDVLVKLQGDEVIDVMAYVYCESVRDGKETILGLVDIGQNHVELNVTRWASKNFPLKKIVLIKGVVQKAKEDGFELVAYFDTIIKDAPTDDEKVRELLDWVNDVPVVGASSSEVDA